MGCTASKNSQAPSQKAKRSSDNVASKSPLTDPIWNRPHLQVLHFNDVYNIEEKQLAAGAKPSDGPFVAGGASRFVTAFKEHGKDEKLVLFSGDLFSPSHCKLC